MNPRTLSFFGMNGLLLMRAIDWRTSSSRLLNVSADNAGFTPVSSWMGRRKSASSNVSIPQSVWWIRMISSVPSRRCEIDSERISSSVTTPPALRMTCASPSASPSSPYGFRRASMHARTATCFAGGRGSSPLSNDAAYCSAFCRSSSVTLTRCLLLAWDGRKGGVNGSAPRLFRGLVCSCDGDGRADLRARGLRPPVRRERRLLPVLLGDPVHAAERARPAVARVRLEPLELPEPAHRRDLAPRGAREPRPRSLDQRLQARGGLRHRS